MDFKDYLLQQLNLHPVMQPQDIVKMCYQAAFGAEHLLADMNAARIYFEKEYDSVPSLPGDLYESISPDICRISLPAWKASGMPAEWLFRMFVETARVSHGSDDLFLNYINIASEVLGTNRTAFSQNDWQIYLNTYLEKGISAVHHSDQYRNSEHPAYRIVKSEFLRILPILQKAAALPQKASAARVIAIDGRAASGKSTLAALLSIVLDTDLIHMDDFFLPPVLRTEERLNEPGGNVHYERFAQEVLPHLSSSAAFSYTIFDCGIMDYNGKRTVKTSPWRVVEGSYSHHPYFGNYADLKVYSIIEPEEQMRRILIRDGEFLAEKFRSIWIPMEETYFSHYQICENADLVV